MPEPLSYELKRKPQRQMPYWICLLFIPAAWVGIFMLLLPHTNFSANADPDEGLEFAITASLVGGTILGVFAASLALFVMVLIDFLRLLRAIWKTGGP